MRMLQYNSSLQNKKIEKKIHKVYGLLEKYILKMSTFANPIDLTTENDDCVTLSSPKNSNKRRIDELDVEVIDLTNDAPADIIKLTKVDDVIDITDVEEPDDGDYDDHDVNNDVHDDVVNNVNDDDDDNDNNDVDNDVDHDYCDNCDFDVLEVGKLNEDGFCRYCVEQLAKAQRRLTKCDRAFAKRLGSVPDDYEYDDDYSSSSDDDNDY